MAESNRLSPADESPEDTGLAGISSEPESFPVLTPQTTSEVSDFDFASLGRQSDQASVPVADPVMELPPATGDTANPYQSPVAPGNPGRIWRHGIVPWLFSFAMAIVIGGYLQSVFLMAELWVASHPKGKSDGSLLDDRRRVPQTLLRAWWGLWVGGWFMWLCLAPTGIMMHLAAAILLVIIVWKISGWQNQRQLQWANG